MTKTILRVEDMHCSNCVLRLESLEDELVGVHSISASYQKSQMVIDFDESQIDIHQIIEAIKRKGYRPSLPK